jgi:hypothetical protein
MSISAMRQALEALEKVVKWHSVRDKNDLPLKPINQPPEIKESIDASAALRQAIEEVEKQGLEHSIEVRCFGPHISFITREPMSQYKDGDCFYRIKKEKNT